MRAPLCSISFFFSIYCENKSNYSFDLTCKLFDNEYASTPDTQDNTDSTKLFQTHFHKCKYNFNITSHFETVVSIGYICNHTNT